MNFIMDDTIKSKDEIILKNPEKYESKFNIYIEF